MQDLKAHQVKKSQKSYRVARPTQTGFSSPATHYNEPRIDLNDALVSNPSSTFFVRVSDDSFSAFNIKKNDVLIIDKSLNPKKNQLVLVSKEGDFDVFKIGKEEDKELFVWGVITYIIKSVV